VAARARIDEIGAARTSPLLIEETTAMHALRSVLALVILGLAILGPGAVASAAGPLPPGFVKPVTGTIKILVLGCYFSDTQLPSALSETTVGIKRMYGPKNETPTIPQFFDRVSNGTLQVQADVKDWYKLPHDLAEHRRLQWWTDDVLATGARLAQPGAEADDRAAHRSLDVL
jgi:hypothetical protein